jgi:hypothetical protein
MNNEWNCWMLDFKCNIIKIDLSYYHMTNTVN